jgi:Dot/Icm secretion system protein IcmQ
MNVDKSMLPALKGSETSRTPKSLDLSLKLVGILDKLLTTGDWETSLFLRKAKERLSELRDEAKNLVEQQNTDRKAGAKKESLAAGIIKVYISLYQVDGTNLQAWLQTLKNLTLYNVTRPTYLSEQHVRELISSKVDMQRHAYVEVLVHESDIIPMESVPVDTLGHELLILKEGVIQLQNIVAFIHANKKRYALKDSNLVYEGEVDIV